MFYFLLFLLTFTSSADIIFHKFLELHSALSEKTIDFRHNFFFFNEFTKPPTPNPLNS